MMTGRIGRSAGFPSENLAFEVADELGPEASIRWRGGCDPETGMGCTFETAFAEGGDFCVIASSPGGTIEFPVTICPADAWLRDAASFFGPSVDLSLVRVRPSRFVVGPSGTGWTCGDVIRFKRPSHPEDLPDEATLVHELTHVWEHQSGQAQLLAGLKEQIAKI